MPIQLDKIMSDIAEEKALYPTYTAADKKETDDAWLRVAQKNKISTHEVRSIFKVLQKKYEQEHVKGSSSWKFYSVMHTMYTTPVDKLDMKPAETDLPDLPMDEDEEYEMLEVQEEDDNNQQNNNSGEESPNKSFKSGSSQSTHSTPEKEEKQQLNNKSLNMSKCSSTISVASSQSSVPAEKKLLNTATTIKPVTSTPINTAAALQKKGITMKKTVVSNANNANSQPKPLPQQPSLTIEKHRKMQMPESIKRKLVEQANGEQISSSQPAPKRSNISQSSPPASKPQAQTLIKKEPKKERSVERENLSQQTPAAAAAASTHGYSVITIPSNTTLPNITLIDSSSTATTITAGSTVVNSTTTSNGFNTGGRLEDIDFAKDIIFDAGGTVGTTASGSLVNGNGPVSSAVNRVPNASEIINLGNFDNSLPPTFFKNLCNSQRHEALGLFVSNVMNRLSKRNAAKLELNILRDIVNAQSDELDGVQ